MKWKLPKLCFCFLSITSISFAGEIAITFDDAPREDEIHDPGQKRATRLIDALAKHNVQTAFFSNTARFHGEGLERMKRYAKAGHVIANHTHSHLDLDGVGASRFIEDIKKAHTTLKNFHNFAPWFRFPYLHEGKTQIVGKKIRTYLKRLGYANGYVTVDNYDWYMNKLVQDALQNGNKVHWDRLRECYLEVLWEGIQFYDNIALKTLGRSPKHVLLLHENRLAAMFVGDLIELLHSKGWKVISPKVAYEDPISQIEPDTLFLGQGRVAAIAKTKGYPGPFWKWEEESDLEKLFEDSKAFDKK